MSARGAPKRALRAACIATLTAVALVAGQLAPSPAGAQETPDGLLPPGDWAPWQEDYLLDLIDQAEAALPTLPTSRQELEALGYVDIIAVTGGYEHWVNVSMFADEHVLDPAYPESLVIHRATREVHAAMLFLDAGTTMDDVPEELRWLPGWHTHPELCSNEQGQVVGGTIPGMDLCPPGSSPADGPPMMHVWIVDNECGHRFGGLGVGGFHCDDYGTPLPDEGYPFGQDVHAEADGAVAIDTVFGEPLAFPTGSEGVCNPSGDPTAITGTLSEDHGGGHATFTGVEATAEPADLLVTDDGTICGTVHLELGDGEVVASGDSGSFTISDARAELEIVGTGAYAEHIPEGCSLSVEIGELSGTIAGGAPNAATLSASGVSVAEAPEACGYYGDLLDFGFSLPSTDAEIELDLVIHWETGGGGHDH